ncbi:hypothetical protein GCM10010106_09450 [Thermopolyspora flexuosa]|jgi:hypothetical protein|uniref:Uncharacterized protein n=1 Tax=Thermopolyspora flexuosa TaxID=103836 RepID=A0A543J062_9ACTN|nr:hypothetical protein [Thermopolyspora flexuosa]TQM76209.1 hypothetical protein FHX40_2936 [Thermopolyspora flexuosa]GGM65584.1 hypothetical protein GCM10010106_09450 [Thermopolyspora flexuosa]
MGQCLNVRYLDRIPAKGMFVVGADVVPGRYVCRTPGNGRWIRYPGGNAAPVAGRPDAPGEAEVVIESGDVAFQTHMPGDWLRVGAPGVEDEDDGVLPVVDPDLGEDLAARLRARPDLLRHVRTGAPWAGERSRPHGGDWLRLIVLLLLAVFMLGGAAGVDLSPLVFVALAAAGAALYGLRRGAWQRRFGEVAAVAKANPDRFCLPGDLDDRGRALLRRAQEAIRRVRESDVARAGLLEPGENAVTLPRQEWQIAKTLRKVAQLREDQRRLVAEGVAPQAEEALRPLRKALDDVEASVAARVEALERYAERTAEADAAYRAHAQVARVADRAAEYQDLLAETVADELAVSEIDRLARNAADLKKALQESLRAAQQAAVELPRPDEP